MDRTAPTTKTDPELESDEHLLVECMQDPGAFALLYQKYLARIYRYLRVRVGDATEAEDLTAKVFLDALEAIPRYQRGTPFAAWLFTIAGRRAADHHRKKASLARRGLTTSRMENGDDQPYHGTDLLEQIIQDEQLLHLRSLVAQLPEQDRELLHLRFGGQLTFDEIARVTRRKESTVKMSLYRLLSRLEKMMDEKNE